MERDVLTDAQWARMEPHCLPNYAVARLAIDGMLRIVDDPGVIALRGARIDDGSVLDLEAGLRHARTSAPLQDPISLGTALASCGGEKPWAVLIAGMLSGGLAFHLAGDLISSRTLLVPRMEAVELARGATVDGYGGTLAPFDCSLVSTRDASEVLSSAWNETVAALAEARIEPVRVGRGRAVERRKLLELAAVRISTFEVAMASGIAPAEANHLLTRLGVPRRLGGWCRAAVEARVLPDS